MASSFEKLKELDLTRDEVERIGEALKKEEFRKLLTDYVEEIQDPANKKIYEEEIIQLEKERGIDATFINPKPGYVIKTSVDGNRKCFINVCVNENVQKPSSVPLCKDGTKGLQWSLPHSLSPPREDIDNKGVRCQVYDVVFHPDTVHMAHKNKAFFNMLNTTACEAVETNFDVKLDTKNLKFPKLQYKGLPHASIIRKPSKEGGVEHLDPSEKEFFDKLYAQADANQKAPKKTKKSPRKNEDNKSNYTTPKYVIKHRSHVDIQECVEDKQAKIHAATPKELIVEINLPLLKSSSDITLDVTEKTVQLISEKPSKYKLNLTLPYRVNQDNGNAKFDKDLKKLIITLPVKRALFDYNRDDSGVESDHGSSPTTPDYEVFSEKKQVFSDNDSGYRTDFLDRNCHYDLPEFTCHLFENILAFTLNVKNVDESSIQKITNKSTLHIKFVSISSSYYQAHYAFYLKFPTQTIIEEKIQLETWDNNIIIQIPLICDNDEFKYYYYGLNDLDLKQKFLEEPSVLNTVLQTTIPEETEAEISPKSEEETTEICNNNDKSTAININGTSYESSGDELSCSYSPSRSKGILKRLSSNRYFVGRSISESSLDDIVCSSSLDSTIPEDGEMSTSLKKTVRFNDVIMRQLYRSNSSILGQKKKNQRKARNKKRAQERRHSESEASEIEDKKEDEVKNKSGNDNNKTSDNKEEEKNDYINSDIFDMDMSF